MKKDTLYELTIIFWSKNRTKWSTRGRSNRVTMKDWLYVHDQMRQTVRIFFCKNKIIKIDSDWPWFT